MMGRDGAKDWKNSTGYLSVNGNGPAGPKKHVLPVRSGIDRVGQKQTDRQFWDKSGKM